MLRASMKAPWYQMKLKFFLIFCPVILYIFFNLNMSPWFKMVARAPNITSLFQARSRRKEEKKVGPTLAVCIPLKEFSQKSQSTVLTQRVFNRGLGIQSLLRLKLVIERQLTFSATTVPNPLPYKYIQFHI